MIVITIIITIISYHHHHLYYDHHHHHQLSSSPSSVIIIITITITIITIIIIIIIISGCGPYWNHLVGLVVKIPGSRAEDPGFESRLRRGFSGSSHTSHLKTGAPVLPCQAPGVIGSALGLVGPLSVYCDWVRWTVGSSASISVWQHVKLSEQIRP